MDNGLTFQRFTRKFRNCFNSEYYVGAFTKKKWNKVVRMIPLLLALLQCLDVCYLASSQGSDWNSYVLSYSGTWWSQSSQTTWLYSKGAWWHYLESFYASAMLGCVITLSLNCLFRHQVCLLCSFLSLKGYFFNYCWNDPTSKIHYRKNTHHMFHHVYHL